MRKVWSGAEITNTFFQGEPTIALTFLSATSIIARIQHLGVPELAG